MLGLTVAHLLADGGSGVSATPDLWTVLINGSGLAAVVIGLLTGKLRTEGEVKRLEATNDRQVEIIRGKDEQLAAVQAALVDKAIPALVRSTVALESLSPLLQAQVFRRPDGGG